MVIKTRNTRRYRFWERDQSNLEKSFYKYDKIMAHDEFNSGVSHGFCMAKLELRDIDRQLSDCESEDIYKVGKSNLYNIKKDFLYEIYEAINKMMKEEVHENDY